MKRESRLNLVREHEVSSCLIWCSFSRFEGVRLIGVMVDVVSELKRIEAFSSQLKV